MRRKHKSLLLLLTLLVYTGMFAQNPRLQTNFGHLKTPIRSVKFSPDGKMLVSGGDAIKLWDMESGEVIKTFKGHIESVVSVVLSSDGKTLASNALPYDGKRNVKLWDIATGKEIQTFESSNSLYNKDLGLIFSTDGKILASQSEFWDTESGKEINSLKNKDSLYSLYLESCPYEIVIPRWGTINYPKKVRKTINNELWNNILSVKWNADWAPETWVNISPDNKMLTVRYENKDTIYLWDMKSNQKIRAFVGTSVSFSPDGKILAVGNKNGNIQLFGAESGKEIKTLKEPKKPEPIHAINFSADGNTMALGVDTTIILWNIKNNKDVKILRGHSDEVNTVNFSPNGEFLASGSLGILKLWNIKKGTTIKTLSLFPREISIFLGDAINDATLTVILPIENVRFISKGKNIVFNYNDTVRIWNRESNEELKLAANSRYADVGTISFSLSADEKSLAYTSNQFYDNASITLHDLTSNKEIKKVNVCEYLNDIDFGNNKIIALACRDKTLKLWDIVSGKEIRSVNHTEEILSIQFSSDYKTLVSHSIDSIMIWDTESLELIKKVDGRVKSNMILSPDDKTLVYIDYDNSIKLRDIQSGKLLATIYFIGRDNNYDWIIYTPDGKYDGINCNKYLHRIKHNKIYKLQENDKKHVKNLLKKIMRRKQ